MNLDELKTVWKDYDRRLQTTRLINEKIISIMIAERSHNRFAKARKEYLMGLIWMFFCFTLSIVVIVTNPFDYSYAFQYGPMAIFGAGLMILIFGLLRSCLTFQNIAITQNNVGDALKSIISVYEKPKKFFHYTIIVFLFSQVVLFPLSFLPRNIENTGLGAALAERLIPIAISSLILYAAYRLGVFKQRHVGKFKEDLSELHALKKMSAELLNEN